jgi:hypothetical protein
MVAGAVRANNLHTDDDHFLLKGVIAYPVILHPWSIDPKARLSFIFEIVVICLYWIIK